MTAMEGKPLVFRAGVFDEYMVIHDPETTFPKLLADVYNAVGQLLGGRLVVHKILRFAGRRKRSEGDDPRRYPPSCIRSTVASEHE